jgi:hypothetical protein
VRDSGTPHAVVDRLSQNGGTGAVLKANIYRRVEWRRTAGS